MKVNFLSELFQIVSLDLVIDLISDLVLSSQDLKLGFEVVDDSISVQVVLFGKTVRVTIISRFILLSEWYTINKVLDIDLEILFIVGLGESEVLLTTSPSAPN